MTTLAHASVFFVAALSAVGCGDADKSGRIAHDTSAPDAAATSKRPSGSSRPEQPRTGAAKFSGQSRETYETARFLCDSKPPEKVARDLGLKVTVGTLRS